MIECSVDPGLNESERETQVKLESERGVSVGASFQRLVFVISARFSTTESSARPASTAARPRTATSSAVLRRLDPCPSSWISELRFLCVCVSRKPASEERKKERKGGRVRTWVERVRDWRVIYNDHLRQISVQHGQIFDKVAALIDAARPKQPLLDQAGRVEHVDHRIAVLPHTGSENDHMVPLADLPRRAEAMIRTKTGCGLRVRGCCLCERRTVLRKRSTCGRLITLRRHRWPSISTVLTRNRGGLERPKEPHGGAAYTCRSPGRPGLPMVE